MIAYFSKQYLHNQFKVSSYIQSLWLVTRFEFLHIALGIRRNILKTFGAADVWPGGADGVPASTSLSLVPNPCYGEDPEWQARITGERWNFLWNTTWSWSRTSKKERQHCILLHYSVCMKVQGLEWVRKNSTWEKTLEKLIKNKRLVRKYLASIVSIRSQ